MSGTEEGDFDPYEDEGEFSEDEDDSTYLKFLEKYELGKTIGTFADTTTTNSFSFFVVACGSMQCGGTEEAFLW